MSSLRRLSPPLHLLRAFSTVTRFGGVSRAAEALHLTQSAVSKQIKELEAFGLDKMPICVAKTQYSLSDNPALLGAPKGFKVTVKDVRVCTGAGFIVCQTSNIMTMPGLPKVPAANRMDIDENGVITGLF